MTDTTDRQVLKIIIAGVAVVMLFGGHLVARDKLRAKKRLLFDGALLLLTALSIFAYFEFGWLRYDRYMNPHDGFHYYMGAKYSEEHRYFDLYRTALIADQEMSGVYTQNRIRNLDTHRYETVATVVQDKAIYKQSFTPARWEDFKKDIRYFQSIMPAAKWNRVLRDKGYNATPVWNAAARWLFERSPTDSVWNMRFLTYIDLICLVVMFTAIWATFGWRIMAFAILFHATNYFMSFVHIKGGMMRLDWVTMLVLGLCFVKMRCYSVAGGVMAYAAMARVFPAIFCFGLGVKFLFNILAWTRDRIRPGRPAENDEPAAPVALNRDYLAFFASFTIVSALLVALSAYSDGGFGLWDNFREKILVHNSDISTTRAGFKYIFLYGQENYARFFEAHQTLWWSIMAAVLLVTAFLVRKVHDYEAITLGFVPAFFLTAPTFYYYVMLLVPIFLFLPRLEKLSRASGAALMFLLTGAAFTIRFWEPHGIQHFFILSCCLLALIVYMAGTALCARGAPQPFSRPPLSPSKRFMRNALALFAVSLPFMACLVVAQAKAPTAPAQVIAKNSDEVELLFVGDVMLSRNVARSIEQNDRQFGYLFAETGDILRGADVAFCNLESPISGRGTKLEKKYSFNAPVAAVSGLVEAGFDVVSLANNHILDYGTIALDDTEKHLTDNLIHHIGMSTSNAPQEPAIITVRGLRIGYLAYCDPKSRWGTAHQFKNFERKPARGTPENIKRDLDALKKHADIAIVSLHWGVEYESEPNAGQIQLARAAISMGADIVAGHHPHVQQETEVYENGLILYSMGNFVFDQHSRPATRISRIYRVFVGAEGITHAEYLPATIPKNKWQPRVTGAAITVMPTESVPSATSPTATAQTP